MVVGIQFFIIATNSNNISLFSKSSRNFTYVITFDASGGNVNPSNFSMQSGHVIGTLPTPTRIGHIFAGWFSAPTGGVQITENTIVNDSVTYFARWTPVSTINSIFTITVMEFANTDINRNVLGTIGTVFESQNIRYITPIITYNYSASATINRILNIRIINPDGNLMEGVTSPIGYTYSHTLNLNPTRRVDRVSLSGWGNDSGGSFSQGTYVYEIWSDGQLLYNARLIVITDDSTQQQTHATVTFHINNGSGTVPVEQRVDIGSIISLPNDNGFYKLDHSFSGWNTRADGSGTNFDADSSIAVRNTVTLFARWVLNDVQQ